MSFQIGSFVADMMRRHEEYLDWVAGLKPGDPVVVQGPYGVEFFATIKAVDEQTVLATHPQIEDHDETMFNKAGMNGYFVLAEVGHVAAYDLLIGVYTTAIRRRP